MDIMKRGGKKTSRSAEPQKRNRSSLYVAGSPYAKRLQDFLGGDRTAFVSDAFRDAIHILGTGPVRLETLSGDERRVLASRDLRWEQGPDGVLLWAAPGLHKGTTTNLPNCSWLFAEVKQIWDERYGATPVSAPPWLEEWCANWARWGYRYLSSVYERALQEAREGTKSVYLSAGVRVSSQVKSLRIFFVEYLPQSILVDDLGRWPSPEALLEPAPKWLDTHDLRDDFWNKCCAKDPSKVQTPKGQNLRYDVGRTLSSHVQEFLEFVARRLGGMEAEIAAAPESGYQCPFVQRNGSGAILVRDKDGKVKLPLARSIDKSFSWIERELPHLRAWQAYAADFTRTSSGSAPHKISAISLFVGRYLATAGRAGEAGEKLNPEFAKHPLELLKRVNRMNVPDTLDRITSDHIIVRRIIQFIDFILLRDCTILDASGTVRIPDFDLPYKIPTGNGSASSSNAFETVRSPMPYAWVQRARLTLVEGAHFKDWKWAQGAQQSELGFSADWYEVDQSLLNPEDPDCVWRHRTTGSVKARNLREFYEVWSPVRWVALLTILTTALRTLQVRVLDSGESDGWRFDLVAWAKSQLAFEQDGTAIDPWIKNDLERRNPALARCVVTEEYLRKRRGKRDPSDWSNGVLYRWTRLSEKGPRANTLLHINTNKTADRKREGAAKGFHVPLPIMPCPLMLDETGCWVEKTFSSPASKRIWLEDLSQNIHWWLAKLRNWQENYNPVNRRIAWKELEGTGVIAEKNNDQYEMHRPACFLFREPSMRGSNRHPGPAYPLPDNVVGNAWWTLNLELQTRFAHEGKTNIDGSAVRLVRNDSGIDRVCVFDKHCIRVSLMTALVVEGKVPVEVMQGAVGHSRVLMTLYYTKPNSTQIQDALIEGFKRINASAAKDELRFLRDADAEQLRSTAAYHDEASAFAAVGISREREQRSVIAWLQVIGGICAVGAAATNTEGGLSAGCFNGGELIGSAGKGVTNDKYGPVVGGPRTCPNCRWLITTPAHLPELVAMFETTQYRIFDADQRSRNLAEDLAIAVAAEDMAFEKRADQSEMLQHAKAVEQATALCDSVNEQGIVLKVTLGNTYRLIQRCLDIVNRKDGAQDRDALILSGGRLELSLILEETTSEMLQLARVSQHSEVFPELDPGKAILRYSQIIARKLSSEGVDPFLILNLSEEEQRRVGNALMRAMARRLSPTNDEFGIRAAVKLIEGPHTIAEALGIKTAAMPEFLNSCTNGEVQQLRFGLLLREH